MNVLFLTVSAGGGHIKAAQAINDYISSNYPDSSNHIIDAYKYISPLIDKLVIGSYLKTLKNSPKLWGKLYELAEKDSSVNELVQALNKFISYKIKRFVREFNPDVIVCTHPFPLQMVCNLKKNKQFNTPIVNILTDYAAHKAWINDYVDAYIVAHNGLIYDLTERGVPKEKIYPLGIPIDNNFLKNINKGKLRTNLKLNVSPVFLIMGGSLGIGDIKKLFSKFLCSDKNFQIIVVCGQNVKLKKQLEHLYNHSNTDKNVIILGYANNMNELMSISDILITKPGGLTITEALLMKLPIVIYSPIPGQEEKNASFLMNNGVGILLDNINHFDRDLFQYVENPIRIKHIKEMSEYLSKPNSTQNIVNFLNKLSQKANN